jgi:hypothetical protein
MNTETKGTLIGNIVKELKIAAFQSNDFSFCEGDIFFSLAFKTDAELVAIAKACGINSKTPPDNVVMFKHSDTTH